MEASSDNEFDIKSLMRSFLVCDNPSDFLIYLKFVYKDLVIRSDKQDEGYLSETILADFLNIPLFIAKSLSKTFKILQNKKKLDQEAFVYGMQVLFFGPLDILIYLVYRTFDLNSMDFIFIQDAKMIMNYLKFSVNCHIDVEEKISKFFDKNTKINFDEFYLKLRTQNSDLLVLFLIMIYHNQAFNNKIFKFLNTKIDSDKYSTEINDEESQSITGSTSFNFKKSIIYPSFILISSINNFSKKRTTILLNSSEASSLSSDCLKKEKDKFEYRLENENFEENFECIFENVHYNYFLVSKLIKTIEKEISFSYELFLIDDNIILFQQNKKSKTSELVEIIPLQGLIINKNPKETTTSRPYIIFCYKNIGFNECDMYNRIFYFESNLERDNFYHLVSQKHKFDNIMKDFKFMREIDKGNYGSILLAEDKKTSEKFAIKKINKFSKTYEKDDKELLREELDIFSYLINNKHKNIIDVYKIYESYKSIYIVMQYMEEGNLRSWIDYSCSEFEDKKNICKQLLEGISFLNENGIIHRDIKLENILVHKLNGKLVLKIIDFGFSTIVGLYQPAIGSYGTLLYAAPEIFLKKLYDKRIDIWSYGIVVFYIFYSEFPFKSYSTDKKIIKKKICYEDIRFPEEDVNDQRRHKLQEFISSCLQKNLYSRIQSTCMLNSEFLK
jgi:tRNA A-37 threonylcarbamoyl transferase component Bud32